MSQKGRRLLQGQQEMPAGGDSGVSATHIEWFEAERRRLGAIAYRMTGSQTDAEDAVQETFVRFQACDLASLRSPRAFLSQLLTRYCLDQLKSARARRELYVGTWLPDPVLDANAFAADTSCELAADISVALLLALERLPPPQRAAFLLHDVFDVGYDEVAATLGRSEESCRQLASRARSQVRQTRPRERPSSDVVERVWEAFLKAAGGDTEPLCQVLAKDAVYYSDGGGKEKAATRPVFGRERIVRFIEGIVRKFPDTRRRILLAEVNGAPGLVLWIEGRVEETMALDLHDGELTAIYSVRNPDKLRRFCSEADGAL